MSWQLVQVCIWYIFAIKYGYSVREMISFEPEKRKIVYSVFKSCCLSACLRLLLVFHHFFDKT